MAFFEDATVNHDVINHLCHNVPFSNIFHGYVSLPEGRF